MDKTKVIAAWSKCKFEIAKTPDTDTMPDSLTDIGVIKDKSSTLEATDGETLELKATGGITVAEETQEGGYELSTRVIEPTFELLTLLGLGEVAGEDDFDVKTHVVDGEWAVKVTPKNLGAIGLKAPKTTITYKPGWNEEEGNYADIKFKIIFSTVTNKWYTRFKRKATDALSAPTGQQVAIAKTSAK